METLRRATTGQGEIALRRRDGVLELIVNGVFAMDSLATASELALADLAGDPPGDVLVGGLGLGFTAARLLDRGAAGVDVVELAGPLIAWAREGVAEPLARVAADPRVRLRHADVVDFVASATNDWDAILLDVDNGPSFLIHESNARAYTDAFLRACLARLRPGGRLLVWCEQPSPGLEATLRAIAGDVEAVEVPVTREGRDLTPTVYRASDPR